MINLILCGGSGTRLWPLSRNLMPKQFYPLLNDHSLFEETVKRNMNLVQSYYIAVNKNQFFLAKDQLLGLGKNSFKGILEPVGRNTAPAIALAALDCEPDELILVTPSDHIIHNVEKYQKTVKKAVELANKGFLVTFGIEPDFPETGFGYIKYSNEDVIEFVEKPNTEKAKEYLASGKYLWNSGMFCFKASTILEELKEHHKDLYTKVKTCYQNSFKSDSISPDIKDMTNIPSLSIDYAVMELSNKVKVIKSNFGWSDLGSFDSLYSELYRKDIGNALLGVNNKILVNSKNNFFMSSGRRIAAIDVEDLIVVDSEDALLISKRGSSQKVREVVSELKYKEPYILEAPQTVKRPWGSYTVLQDPSTFKVKRIEVKPKKRLSLQYHKKRQEHWTIVQGTAKVTIGEDTKVMTRNDQAYIPLEAIHRVENVGDDKLIFIETQIGSYFGEDDIIRIEDDWGRT